MKKTNLYFLLLFLVICSVSQSKAQKQFRALLFTRTMGFHHESIHDGVAAIRAMADKHFFDVEWHEDPTRFTDNNLARYDVIIFLNTTGDILNPEQQIAMEKFIRAGKGFVGVHSATDTEYEWEWYTKLIGRLFKIHPAIQTARLKLTENKFPGMEGFHDNHIWTDEWYDFGPEKINDLKYILSIDETSYNPKAQWGQNKSDGMGSFHPIAWYHDYDGGRAFYTGLGHIPAVYRDQVFLDHLYAGILYAAKGKK